MGRYAREQKKQIMLEMELEDAQHSDKLTGAAEKMDKQQQAVTELSNQAAQLTSAILVEFCSGRGGDPSQLVIQQVAAGKAGLKRFT